jgi:hypothetical protein
VSATGEVDGDDKRRRNRRTPEQTGGTDGTTTISRLCAKVAYHYGLTPKEVAEFSGQQLMMWYEASLQETGQEKSLDLEVSLIPHTENPDRAVADMRFALERMGRKPDA